MKRSGILAALSALIISLPSFAQYNSRLSAEKWVDSVYRTLNDDQRIAQLMIIRAYSNKGVEANVVNDIKKYNVGSLCFFQGGAAREAQLTNYYQAIAKTPLMITIDGEYGLGMRLDSIIKYPYQLTMGAMADEKLVYKTGYAIGMQCKRLGIHVDYAPDVDVNNNPNNPVIGFRSFGEDKYKVAKMGIAYMKGLQDAGVMATAKHFPGHGDVAVDSHLDLPVIKKSMAELEALELYPFEQLFAAGVQSVMVGHLYVPAIDSGVNRATSISKNAVTGLLRNKMGYNGLVFTDALEMKGVAKYFPGGTIAVEALVAGNDMLCLPESVAGTIAAVKDAIKQKRLSWNDINDKVKKVLLAKYNLGLQQLAPIAVNNITSELNSTTNSVRAAVAKEAVTLLQMAAPKGFQQENSFTLPLAKNKKIAYVHFGTTADGELARRMQQDYKATIFNIKYTDDAATAGAVIKKITAGNYDALVLGMHNINVRKGDNNYGLAGNALQSWAALNREDAITLVFGNALAAANFCTAKNLALFYEDDSVFQHTAANWLRGDFVATGTIPVSVCNWKYGQGIRLNTPAEAPLQTTGDARFAAIDTIVTSAIAQKAFPGCVILAAKDGRLVYHKAFGKYEYDSAAIKTRLNSIYDLASVTKVSAVTVSIMKLYDEKKLDLNKTLGYYLPWVKNTNKAGLTLKNILLHQAGMVPYITFYKEILNDDKTIKPELYRAAPEAGFTTEVANGIYLRNDWQDTIWKRIIESPVTPQGVKYVYSDNDFWFLGKIVESVAHQPLEQYVQQTFYQPMNMVTTGYHPLRKFSREDIVPTEKESGFRNQLLWGTVHDEGAALGGGVAGHAGLFSDAFDLGKLYQMLLNGGTYGGKRYINAATVKLFTAYQSPVSRRGYGFDKPEKDNAASNDPYPSSMVSPQTFGHTGFTGTCVWADPATGILYIFLSNRVNPTRENGRLSNLNVRGRVQDEIYKALQAGGK